LAHEYHYHYPYDYVCSFPKKQPLMIYFMISQDSLVNNNNNWIAYNNNVPINGNIIHNIDMSLDNTSDLTLAFFNCKSQISQSDSHLHANHLLPHYICITHVNVNLVNYDSTLNSY